MIDEFLWWVQGLGRWDYAIFGLVAFLDSAAFVGLVLPGETVLVYAGYLAARGQLDPVALYVFLVLGAVAGDTTAYAWGRRWARRHDLEAAVPLVPPRTLARARRYLRERGRLAVFGGRFLHFLRPVMPFVAGMAPMPLLRFWTADVPACLVWAGLTVGAGFLAGTGADWVERWLGHSGLVVVGIVGAVLLARWIWTRFRQLRGSRAPPRQPPPR